MYKSYLLSLFAITLFLNSCTYDVATPNTCFQEDVLPIFVTKCNYSGCHNSIDKVDGFDLSNYEGVMRGIQSGKPNQSEIFKQIRSGEMPPSGHIKLSLLEKTIIKNWIKMGAPNSSNCSSCDTTYSYNNRIKPLLEKWCISCHTANNQGGGYELSTYQGVTKSILDNRFLGSINQEVGYYSMPKNASRLSDCDIKSIKRWVDSGYPNN